LRVERVLFQVVMKHFPVSLIVYSVYFWVVKLRLGLTFKLWLSDLHRDYGCKAFTEVVTADIDFHLVEKPGAIGVRLQRTGQRSSKARYVGTPLVRINVVDIGDQILGKRCIVAHRYLDGYISLGTFDVDRFGNKLFPCGVDVFDKLPQATF